MADKLQGDQTQQENHVADELGKIIDEEIYDNFDARVVNNYCSQSNISAIKLTFDDIPPTLWKARFQQMKAWCSNCKGQI